MSGGGGGRAPRAAASARAGARTATHWALQPQGKRRWVCSYVSLFLESFLSCFPSFVAYLGVRVSPLLFMCLRNTASNANTNLLFLSLQWLFVIIRFFFGRACDIVGIFLSTKIAPVAHFFSRQQCAVYCLQKGLESACERLEYFEILILI